MSWWVEKMKEGLSYWKKYFNSQQLPLDKNSAEQITNSFFSDHYRLNFNLGKFVVKKKTLEFVVLTMNVNNKLKYCSHISGVNMLTPDSLGSLYITGWQPCELSEEHKVYQQQNRLNQSHCPAKNSGDVLSLCGLSWVQMSLPGFTGHLC